MKEKLHLTEPNLPNSFLHNKKISKLHQAISSSGQIRILASRRRSAAAPTVEDPDPSGSAHLLSFDLRRKIASLFFKKSLAPASPPNRLFPTALLSHRAIGTTCMAGRDGCSGRSPPSGGPIEPVWPNSRQRVDLEARSVEPSDRLSQRLDATSRVCLASLGW
jgi:hypothetical protein